MAGNSAIFKNMKIITILISGLLLLLHVSCDKKEFEYGKEPYNVIESFKIKGYGTIDSIQAVIAGDSILIYWDVAVEQPATITPTIVIPATATLTPASGEAVAFSEETEYTVTAEDGTIRTYRLKPKINQPIPVITKVPTAFEWNPAKTQTIRIAGEYFLEGGDTSAIKVYAQRIRDGFEFGLPLIKQQVTQTNISATIPAFTAEQDSGRHNIFVKIGQVVSPPTEVWLTQPNYSHLMFGKVSLEEDGQPVSPGDILTVNYSLSDNYGGIIARYYTDQNLKSVTLRLKKGNSGATVPYADMNNVVSVKDNKVKFIVPEETPIGYYIEAVAPQFKYMANAENLYEYYQGYTSTGVPAKLTTDQTVVVAKQSE